MIFYNDLPYSLKCNLEAYADDSTLIHSSESVKEIEDVLTRNCVEVQNWMNQNRLKLNAEKTHLLTLGTSNRLATLRDEMVIEMCGQRIIQSPDKNEKLLGVFIQSNLKWRYHLDQLRIWLKSDEYYKLKQECDATYDDYLSGKKLRAKSLLSLL